MNRWGNFKYEKNVILVAQTCKKDKVNVKTKRSTMCHSFNACVSIAINVSIL